MPRSRQEMVFYEWGRLYGDVIYLYVMNRSFLVLNSYKAATTLLEKRGNNYSGRPQFRLLEMMGWQPSLTLLDYGKKAQLHRKMFQQYLSKDKCATYQPVQLQRARQLCRRLLSNPKNFQQSIERFATGIIVQMTYGHQIDSDGDDWYYKIAQKATIALFDVGPPGGTPIDFFPFLRYFPSWFPGTYYANLARKYRHLVRKLHEAPVTRIQAQMAHGDAESSFVLSQLESMRREGTKGRLTLDDIQGTAAIMHAAGTDTVVVSLLIFILAMVLHPECQRRAQEEIDVVIGRDRLPQFSDRASLPYVEAVWQESLRWHQAAPLGLPHLSSEDDVYEDMFIPKGSLVFANIRAMTLDENVYSNPKEFIPERFLPKPVGNGEPYPPIFGWGRRICPGRHFGDGSLWIAIATILATTTITNAIDEWGQKIIPEVRFKSAILNLPYPFECKFRDRGNVALVPPEDGLI
ncbi:O-methylsterigmatocystin oxidoreductase [Termitomyces sp. T112]|nr:O-methylsterigmatocystin oxidoreductase [Termitomyces sp. T112]